jgi:acyl carrier protein
MLYNSTAFPFTVEEVKENENTKSFCLKEGVPVHKTKIMVLLPISIKGAPKIIIDKTEIVIEEDRLYYLDINTLPKVHDGDAQVLYLTIDPNDYPFVEEYRKTHKFLSEENLPLEKNEDCNIIRRINKVIASTLRISEETITQEKLLQEDLGADSLDIVNLILFLQDEFQLQDAEPPTAETLESLTTVASLTCLIESYLESSVNV